MRMIVGSLVLIWGVQAFAATTQDLINQRKSHLQKFYRDLHENPELSGQEKRTAGKLAEELKSLGLEVKEGIGGTGVVGILRNGEGPVTWIRADMDGLPVTENTGLSFKSKNLGVMHACGHDHHMASLAGVAYVMANSKDLWQGTLVFIGQPAEELGRGAIAMLKDNLLKKVPKPNTILALHVTGLYKEGAIGVMPGFAMANADSVDVTFKGRGTHGSSPEGGIDPFVMSAEFILRLQTIVGREKKAINPGVISVGSIHGGTKNNIIPDDVKLQLTVRSYDDETRQLLLRRITEVAQGIAKTSGASEPVVVKTESADALFNDLTLSEKAKTILTREFGALEKVNPTMGAEDFGQFGLAAKVPSLMFWVGTGGEKPMILNHSPKYNPKFDKTYARAVQAMTAVVMDLNMKSTEKKVAIQ